jgi:selenium metabolism protein YedF
MGGVKFMSINIDARGLACPQPVIATKKTLDEITEGVVTVLVDNLAAKENVTKLAVANNCGVSVEEQAGYYQIRITKGAPASDQVSNTTGAPVGETVYLISSKHLGQGSDELGAILIKAFFVTLAQSELVPRAILFINSGVWLTADGSPVLDQLRALAEQGVEIISCGTCLDYFQLKERLAVGEITNMYSILAKMNGAGKAITL